MKLKLYDTPPFQLPEDETRGKKAERLLRALVKEHKKWAGTYEAYAEAVAFLDTYDSPV